MKINVTIEIDDEELKKLFNLKSEEEYPGNKFGEQLAISQYAKVFDDSCVGWTKDPEYSMHFLKYCNDLLNSRAESSMIKRGYLFLNEVAAEFYDMLGIPRTVAGTKVGWVYNEEKPIGDNFVDFDLMNERNSDFINGYKNTALLDFNVDGSILNYI